MAAYVFALQVGHLGVAALKVAHEHLQFRRLFRQLQAYGIESNEMEYY